MKTIINAYSDTSKQIKACVSDDIADGGRMNHDSFVNNTLKKLEERMNALKADLETDKNDPPELVIDEPNALQGENK